MFPKLIKQLFDTGDPAAFVRERLAIWHDWLVPLLPPHSNGVGRDPAYDDAYLLAKEEVAKLSDIDNAMIATACETLLKEVGKDIRVAGYYLFARVRQSGATGFADGLELCAALVDRFGQTLFPERAEAKRGALEWVTTARIIDQLDRYAQCTPDDLRRIMVALQTLVDRTKDWPQAAKPDFHPLVSHFTACENKHGATPERSTTAAAGASMSGHRTGTAATAIASMRDALDHTRVIARFLHDQENGYLSAARLVRCMRWDSLHDIPPEDTSARTRLAPPRAELRSQLKRLVLQKQWQELRLRVEGAFMEGANHLWLDLQHYQHIALEQAGSPYTEWSGILNTDLAHVLARLPGIERLAFNDGTPFASDTTLEWIARVAVVRELDAGESIVTFAPIQVEGQEAAHTWHEMALQAFELAQKESLDAALAWLASLPDFRSERHRFMQRWIMARTAHQAGRSDMAVHLLERLDQCALTFQLDRWDPSLTFDVKHHLFTTLCSMQTPRRINKYQDKHADKHTDESAMAARIETLRAELTVLDPARAVSVLLA